jgi:hypothetical protein
MQRISKTLKKAHGAFCAFLARLRDSFFWVSREDLDLLVAFLKRRGLTDDEIQRKKEIDWVFFLRNSRRFVPPKDILLKRFNRVCQFYNDIKDAFTGQPLFSDATWKEVESLRIHITKGCLSDVPGIPMYFTVEKLQTAFQNIVVFVEQTSMRDIISIFASFFTIMPAHHNFCITFFSSSTIGGIFEWESTIVVSVRIRVAFTISTFWRK